MLRIRTLLIVAAVAACGETAAPGSNIPPAPTTVLAVARPGEIVVSWHDVSDKETSYRIEVSTSGDWTLLSDAPANTTSVTHSSVEHGVTYHYRVHACNDAGCSEWVEASTAWVGGTSPSILSLSASQVGTDHASLIANVAHGGAIAYVYFMIAPVGQDISTGVRTASAQIRPPVGNVEGNEMTTANVYGLAEGTAFNIVAVVSNGIGTASKEGTLTTSRTGPPIFAAGPLSALPQSSTSVRMTATLDPGGMSTQYWFDVVPADSSFDQALRVNGDFTPLITGNITPVGGTATQLRLGTTYQWRARATNAAGTATSAVATFRTANQ